jgi:hypothetical protein
MSKKKKWKKVKNQDSMYKTNFFLAPCPSALGNFSHMAACRNSLENIRKMNLIFVLNKTSLRAHTELELDVLGVHGKLVKYVVHSSKRKNWRKNYFSSHELPKQQSTNFWSQGILGVNLIPKNSTRSFYSGSKRWGNSPKNGKP